MNRQAGEQESIRERFRVFLDDDAAFRKFIRTCNVRSKKRGRLTYAQEEVWQTFVEANPDLKSMGFEEIIALFHLCHIHLKPLRSVKIPIMKGLYCQTRTPEAERQLSEEAYYSLPNMIDSSAWGESTHISDEHCDDCVARRRQIEGSGNPPNV